MRHLKRMVTVIASSLLATTMLAPVTHAATYSAQEQANMKVVAEFYAALDQGDAAGNLKKRIRGIAEQYLKQDYIQHTDAQGPYGTGREGFIRMFESMPAMGGPPGAAPAGAGAPGAAPQGAPPAGMGPPPPAKVIALMANGDLVVRISSRTMPGSTNPSFIFNMFRLQDGKLAEHWDGASGGMSPGKGAALGAHGPAMTGPSSPPTP
jgi:predicted SnoaL-like aldol condensation-catalyzing enzyme